MRLEADASGENLKGRRAHQPRNAIILHRPEPITRIPGPFGHLSPSSPRRAAKTASHKSYRMPGKPMDLSGFNPGVDLRVSSRKMP